MQRHRDLTDAPSNRRRNRSVIEGKPGRPDLDLDTPEGAKARQVLAEQDIADLQRKWREEAAASGSGPGIIDMGDSAVYTGYSKPYYPLAERTLKGVTGTLSAAGDSDTVANVYHNETLLGTLTIPAGAVIATLTVTASFTEADYWQMLVTQAGASASGLTFYGDFS